MESLTSIFFYIIAAVLLFSSVAVIFAKNIVNSALFGCLAFLSVGGIYFLLNATFNAVVQISVYVVAVTILIVFAVMLTARGTARNLPISLKPRAFASFVPLLVVFFGIMLGLLGNYLERVMSNMSDDVSLNKSLDVVNVIGEKLMTDYVLPFELVSVVLLVLVVGIGLVCTVNKNGEKH